MARAMPGLNREEMSSALRRKGQRIVPVKWDDFSDRYMHTHADALKRLYERWGTDYVQVAPWYRNTPAGNEALQGKYSSQRGEKLRGFSPSYSDYVDEWGCLWKTTDPDEVGGNCVDHPYHTVEEALGAAIPDPSFRADSTRYGRRGPPIRASSSGCRTGWGPGRCPASCWVLRRPSWRSIPSSLSW